MSDPPVPHDTADKNLLDVEAKDPLLTLQNAEPAEETIEIAERSGFLWKITHRLAKLGVEEQGIERFSPDNRQHKQTYTLFTLWLTANCTICTISLGTFGVGPLGLGFRDAVLAIVFFNLLGCIPPALIYFFGYYTNSIPIILNALSAIGSSCVNAIIGGLALAAVTYNSSLPNLPIAASIVIISLTTFVIAFMGYRVIHLYLKYSWIPAFVCFIILAIEVAKRGATAGPWGGSGSVEAANVLTFGAALFGFSISLMSLAADYSCQLPEHTSATKIFTYTYLGIIVPSILLEVLGAAAMTTFLASPTIGNAYNASGLGGLLASTLIEPLGGFGRFLIVLLSLSVVGNNIPSDYSFALTAQALHPWIQHNIPRPVLTAFATITSTALAIAGASNFYGALGDLLSLTAYWLSAYATIAFIEHYVFRQGKWSNWDLNALNSPRAMPLGIASGIALVVGLTGALLGASTAYLVGPLAKTFGIPGVGGDIGFELGIAFTAVAYPGLRWVEKNHVEPRLKWGHATKNM